MQTVSCRFVFKFIMEGLATIIIMMAIGVVIAFAIGSITMWFTASPIILAIALLAVFAVVAIIFTVNYFIHKKKNTKESFLSEYGMSMVIAAVAIAIFVPLIAGGCCSLAAEKYSTPKISSSQKVCVDEAGNPVISYDEENDAVRFLIETNGKPEMQTAYRYEIVDSVESVQYCHVYEAIDNEHRYLMKTNISQDYNVLLIPECYASLLF